MAGGLHGRRLRGARDGDLPSRSGLSLVGVTIHGGYGFTGDFNVERCWRDPRILGLYEGTNEVQEIILADRVLEQGTE